MIKADSVHSTPPTNTSANNPPDASDGPEESLYRRTDIAPEAFFRALGRLRRGAGRDRRLLRFLDETEPDPDLEPYLAGYSLEMDDREGGESEDEGADGADDREGDELQHGGKAANEDDEPSLGWTDEEAACGRTYAGAMGKRPILRKVTCRARRRPGSPGRMTG